MKNVINILDKLTINQISAGEVVEKPSSIVKELIENSIDAESKTINIEIKEGGKSYIRVSDDGVGIDKSQLDKVFLRHSTSKISSISDITKISTNGFRGEALSAISSVSKVTLISRFIDAEIGNKLYVEESKIISNEPFSTNQGTTIIVEDVFYNTPARMKFLKNDSKENLDTIDLIMRFAIAKPEVRFKLIIDGKTIFQTIGDGNLLNTIRTVYGKSIVSNLIEINKKIDDNIILDGYISNTSGYSSTKKNQVLQINSRIIKISPLFSKLEFVYKNIIPIRKHPNYFLNIKITSELVDPNVHPSKLEVKIENSKNVEDLIYYAIKDTLFSSSSNMVPNVVFNSTKIENTNVDTENAFSKSLLNKTNYIDDTAGLNYFVSESINNIPSDEKYGQNLINNLDNNFEIIDTPNESHNEDVLPISEMLIIGRVFGTYLIAVSRDYMYYIDQHAAHERILFENYMEQYNNQNINSQILLVPQLIELSIEDYQTFLENIEFINSYGFNSEGFGNKTIVIREVPTLFNKSENEAFLLEVLNAIKAEQNVNESEFYKDKVALIACRSAIKANYNLKTEEGQELLSKLNRCKNKYTCPHGRPIFLKLQKKDIEIMFKRSK